jgi:ParB family chromosome partitioning protein
MDALASEEECWRILRAHFHSPGPLEVARALRRLMESFHKSQRDIATTLSLHRTTLANAVRVLRLSRRVLGMLERGELSFGHARALLGLDPLVQGALARDAVQKALSVREIEKLARRYK